MAFCLSFSIFLRFTRSTKQGNMGLLIATSCISLDWTTQYKLFLISQSLWFCHFQCRPRKTLLDARAGELKARYGVGFMMRFTVIIKSRKFKSTMVSVSFHATCSNWMRSANLIISQTVRSILSRHLGTIYRINSLKISSCCDSLLKHKSKILNSIWSFK